MKVTDTLYVTNRKAWRRWLRQNHRSSQEIWLVYYSKDSGRPRIPYNDAVEEALCFGWIDSIIKKLDAHRVAQRFTPRKPKSGYSQLNKERLRRLIRQRKVIKAVREAVADALAEPFEFPTDIVRALQADGQAWANFQAFPEPYQRIRVAFVDSARQRPAEFKKRLNHLVKMTARKRQYGYGIESFF